MSHRQESPTVSNLLSTDTVLAAPNQTVGVDTTAGNVNVTLPPAVAGIVGQRFEFVRVPGTPNANNAVIVPDGADTINGNASYSLSGDYEGATLRCVAPGIWIAVSAIGAPAAGLEVNNVGELSGIDDSVLVDGTPVWVGLLRSLFFLRRGPTQTDSVTVTHVNALSGSAVWWRDTTPSRSWWPPNDFGFEQVFIDSTSGDDQNDGLTDSTPVATFDEISRRYCVPGECDTNKFLEITVGPGGAIGTLTLSCDCQIDSVPTTDTATAITAVVAEDQATNTRQLVTSTRAWALDTFYQVVESGDLGYVASNPTGTDAETQFFSNAFGGLTTPTNTQTVQELTLPTLDSVTMRFLGPNTNGLALSGLVLSNCTVTGVVNLETSQCIVTGSLKYNAITFAQHYTTLFAVAPQSEDSSNGMLMLFTACIFEDEFRAPANSRVTFVENVIFARNGTASIGNAGESGPGVISCVRSVNVRDNTRNNVFTIAGYNSRFVFPALEYFWGTNNAGPLVAMNGGCRAFYTSTANLVATSTLPNWAIPGSNGAWAGLPAANANTFTSIGPDT